MTQLSPLGRFEKFLLATDGSEFSAGALRLALAMARQCNAQLTAMTIVLSNPEYDALAPQLAIEAETRAHDIIEGAKQAATAARVEMDAIVRHGLEPAQEIVAQAEAMNADVIIMGRRGRRGLMRMMVGDATSRVCGQAHCSVLVVPKAAQMWQQGILLATDGSRYSDAAAEVAGKLAQLCGLPITVLSVIITSHSGARRDEAAQVVERVKQAYVQAGISAEAVLAEARRPEEAIVETAKASGADLIVVGSHGRTGLEKVLLGSVSERVIGQAEYPVLVVKAT